MLLRSKLVQLGRWDHPPLRLSEEDILMQFEDYPYTEEVNDALKPHLEFLKTLHCSPQDCSVEEVPAKVYVEKSKKPIHQCTIPFTGGLTIEDQARVANWFEKFDNWDPYIGLREGLNHFNFQDEKGDSLEVGSNYSRYIDDKEGEKKKIDTKDEVLQQPAGLTPRPKPRSMRRTKRNRAEVEEEETGKFERLSKRSSRQT
ncbi:hypothetical protein HHX47_DHR3001110 [Lentinula edodes]|nr:hypothetical protein HHX47_DHR4001020 [Lentinula edodes]KAF8829447.1 hypothetical protein HHX47_DHR3001110 [Lentinula edodes]